MLKTLAQGASIAFLLQTTGVGLAYGMQILLAQWMGAAEYGTYQYAITWGTFLAFLAGLGLPLVVLRSISEYRTREDWPRVKGVITSSWQQTLIASLSIALLGTAVMQLRPVYQLLNSSLSLLLGLWTVPLLALMNLQREIARAFRHIALAYAPSLVIWPLMTMAGAFLYLQTHHTLTSVPVIGTAMLGLGVVLAIQHFCFRQLLATTLWHVRPVYELRQWLMAALPLLLIDGAFVVLGQTDVLMIGTLLDSEAVGFYSAALQTARWVNFALFAVNAIAAPMFASLYAQGDRAALQKIISAVAHWVFWPGIAIAIGLIGLAQPILSIFGPEFVQARAEIAVLSVGQLVNVGVGSVGYLLIMTGHQRQCAYVATSSALLNLVLNAIGIPWLGILGAALATAVTMATWNLWMLVLVIKHIRVNSSIVFALTSNAD
ncbi:MAG: oligosaccharide flippase family protein [Cyanothece sp. SIO1E1]|nr:oligosaccharide flippase family protein [Cyanothece sp. SIO1E1]